MRFATPGRRWRRRHKRRETQSEWRGDPHASTLVAGHSHRAAYVAAIGEQRTAGTAVLLPEAGASLDADAAYFRAACSAPVRVLAVVWTGNQHNRHFLFSLDEPFRLHDAGESGTVVPAAMISGLWEPYFAGMERNVRAVQAEHTVLLGTPPPKADEEIRAGLRHEPRLLDALTAAGESADTIAITPAALRVGLWEIMQDDYEAWAARIGAVFVPVPASARTADGCLKPEYSAGDSSHANGAFAALMLGEIEAALPPAGASRQ